MAKKRKIKAIFFDFWGTLIEHGVKPSPLKQLKYFLRVNLPFHEFVLLAEANLFTRTYNDLYEAMGELSKAFGKKVPQHVLEKMIGMWNKNKLFARPYDDVEEVLSQLKEQGYLLVLAVNSDNFTVPAIIEKYGLDKYFDLMLFSHEIGLLKINPQFFKKGLSELNLKPEEALMVGDTIPTDIETAKKVGMHYLLMDRKDRRDFEPKITNLKELQDYLEKLEG